MSKKKNIQPNKGHIKEQKIVTFDNDSLETLRKEIIQDTEYLGKIVNALILVQDIKGLDLFRNNIVNGDYLLKKCLNDNIGGNFTFKEYVWSKLPKAIQYLKKISLELSINESNARQFSNLKIEIQSASLTSQFISTFKAIFSDDPVEQREIYEINKIFNKIPNSQKRTVDYMQYKEICYMIKLLSCCGDDNNITHIISNVIKNTLKLNSPSSAADFYLSFTKWALRNGNIEKTLEYTGQAYLLAGKNDIKIDPIIRAKAIYNKFMVIKNFVSPKYCQSLLETAFKYWPEDPKTQEHLKKYEFINLSRKQESDSYGLIDYLTSTNSVFNIFSFSVNNSKKNLPLNKLIGKLKTEYQHDSNEILQFVNSTFKENPKLKNTDNVSLHYLLAIFYLNKGLLAQTIEWAAKLINYADSIHKLLNDLNIKETEYKSLESNSMVFLTSLVKLILAYENEGGEFKISKIIFNKIVTSKFLPDNFKNIFEKLKKLSEYSEKLSQPNIEIEKPLEKIELINTETKKTDTIQKPKKKKETKIKKIEIEEQNVKIQAPQEVKIKILSFFEVAQYIETNNWELIDPKSLSLYFSTLKKMLNSNEIKDETVEPKAKDLYWKIDENHIFSTSQKVKGKFLEVTKVEQINKYKFNNYHAAIDEHVLSKLGKNQIEFCTQALTKNIIITKHIIKLWTKDDLRLCTDTIFKNHDGECLIVFNKALDHKEVKKANGNLKFMETKIFDENKFISSIGLETIGEHTEYSEDN